MKTNTLPVQNADSDIDLLVLDDDEIALERFRRYFSRQHNVNCFLTDDVADALAVLQNCKVHLALFDFRMPDTNGLVLIQQLANARLSFPTEFIINSSSFLTQDEMKLAEQLSVEVIDKAMVLTQTGMDQIHQRMRPL